MLYPLLYDHVLARADPEDAHGWAMSALTHGLASAPLRARLGTWSAPQQTAVSALGLTFASPLGVAAGLDKDAAAVGALGALGFGAVEIGTVTPRPQPGNPRPRIARALADRAIVNAMGFPSAGAEAVAARLALRPAPGSAPGVPVLGINVGKNRDTPIEAALEDYVAVAGRLAPLADYLVLNVSSPNTPGLRALEQVSALEPIVAAVAAVAPDTPLLVKISPDLADADVDAVAALAVRQGLAGVIATNTSVDRGLLSPRGRDEVAAFSGGGVSGPPLRARSLGVLRRLHAGLRGSDAILVSVGGVSGAEDLWERILAGATLVQAYTGFVYGGPLWAARLNRELALRVRQSGAASVGELVGVGA